MVVAAFDGGTLTSDGGLLLSANGPAPVPSGTSSVKEPPPSVRSPAPRARRLQWRRSPVVRRSPWALSRRHRASRSDLWV